MDIAAAAASLTPVLFLIRSRSDLRKRIALKRGMIT
jgi:hypothetical protein